RRIRRIRLDARVRLGVKCRAAQQVQQKERSHTRKDKTENKDFCGRSCSGFLLSPLSPSSHWRTDQEQSSGRNKKGRLPHQKPRIQQVRLVVLKWFVSTVLYNFAT